MVRTQSMAASIGWHLAVLGLIVGTAIWLAPPPPERPEVEIDLRRSFTPPALSQVTTNAASDDPAPAAARAAPSSTAEPSSEQAVPAQIEQAGGSAGAAGTNGEEESPGARTELTLTETPPPNEQSAVVYRSGEDGVSWPQLIPGTDVQPEYPRPARIGRIEGVVELELTIGAGGVVDRVEIIRESPPGYGFAHAAQRAAVQRRYRAATRDGHPVAAKLPVDIEFRLE